MKKRHFRFKKSIFCILLIGILFTAHIGWSSFSIAFADLNLESVPTFQSSNVYDDLSILSLKDRRFIQSFDSLPVLETLHEKENTLLLLATGDIMFHSPQITAAYDATRNEYDFFPSFSQIAPYVQAADYALANFETTTAGDAYTYSGYPAFNAPDRTLDGIYEAGFDFLSTANNHAFDRKLHGVHRTLEQMDQRGFDHNGTFNNTDESQHFLIKEVKNFKLGILSITYGLNGFEQAYDSETLYKNVNLISSDYDPDFVQNQLALMDEAGVDTSIVFIHWGNEYQLEPNEAQQILAQNLVLWGADIILGSHPHVIQKNEIVKYNGEDKYVIYSMGNFISNQSRHTLTSIKNAKYTEDGIMVTIKLEKDQNGVTHLSEVKHIPTWVYKYSESGKNKYMVLPTIDYLTFEGTSSNKNIEPPPTLSEHVLELIKASYNQSMSRCFDYTSK
ncbi:CapA family protein [Fusibacter ferrireducens]|uniref:CapA family protein n=1 Tax=Fusibacter ferrireducens TaxID=2785058 RepID=A0ABR9ZZA5_9FIRM|nr:CapA family protein [Fusibacter ferrireducens]MBF4695493.1 CapA family protein [Fusibacter ferrireducens]